MEFMSGIRTIVTFQSSAFNSTERKEYFIHDGCYGDDVARWLIDHLRGNDIPADHEPTPEELGWHFGFSVGGTDYRMAVGHRSAKGSEPAVWIGRLERKAGRIASKFHRQMHGIQPDAVRLIHSLLSSSLKVRNVRWHHQEDFEAGQEENGATEPMAP
ncbi:conserved hypothetical protein [Verrucomicrobia bacterium]|nr:conserved hypothetical protein [Verrucomicrobiota bacterium]